MNKSQRKNFQTLFKTLWFNYVFMNSLNLKGVRKLYRLSYHLRAGWSEVRIAEGARNIRLAKIFHTNSWTHATSYSRASGSICR